MVKAFFCLLLLTVFTVGKTDADFFDTASVLGNHFQSATLDLSGKNTINNNSLGFLFNTPGILPGGFDVRALRLKNDGAKQNVLLNYNYLSGGQDFCQALRLKILKNWQIISEGGLSDLNLNFTLDANGVEDFIFVLSLENNDNGLKGKTCKFNFLFQTNKEKAAGLWDEETLDNEITSGL